MTTAAKYGAQDLNGNPFNYQQIVGPVNTGTSNVIVNANFANRSASDTKVRLALTSTALASQTVSSIQGLYPFASNSSASTTSVETQQLLPVDTTTTSTNIITSASFLVSATTAGTNIITVNTSAYFVPGTPVVFATSIGGLTAGTVYYVLSTPSATTFTVSNVFNGAIVSLNTEVANVVVQVATTNLSVGQPIQFQGTVFGGLVNQITYYVLTIPSSSTFTVSDTPNGSALALTTATGLMFLVPSTTPAALSITTTGSEGYINTIQGLTISNTTATTNVLTTVGISVTATTAATTSANQFITTAAGGTATLTTGMPVVFSGSIGGLIGGTVYYVLNIFSSTTFNVSAIPNGTAFTLTSASGSINMQHATTYLQQNQPIMFTGTTFGGIAANTTYYVSTIVSSTTFTVSYTPGGNVIPLTTSSGTMVTTQSMVPAPVTVSNTTTSTNILTTATIAVTATSATTNAVTCATTGTLVPGQPVVFSSNLGTIVSGTVYYVLNILSGTTFTISQSQSGAVFPLATATGSISVQHATTLFRVNQPVVFTGTTFGGISSGIIYYIQNIISNTTFKISAVHGGAELALTTASGTMTFVPQALVPTINVSNSTATTNVYTTASISVSATSATDVTCASTATLAVGQPVVFSATANNIVAGTVYWITNITSSTTFQMSATFNGSTFAMTATSYSGNVQQATTNLSVGEPIIFSGSAFGGVSTGVTYYIKTVPSSTTFTISATVNGAVFTLSTTSGTMVTTIGPRPFYTISSSTTSNQVAMQTYSVTGTALTTNLITVSNTYMLSVGMPVVFSGNLGNLVGGVIYYVRSIPTATTFTVSATLNGPVFIQTTAAGSINLQQTTAGLVVNQPIMFQGSGYTGITAGTTYYVRTIDSTTLFTLATTPNVPGSTSTIVSLTGGANLLFNQINNLVVDTFVYRTASTAVTATSAVSPYAITVASSTIFSVGQPVVFDGSLGGLTPYTVYYVNAILSSTTINVSATLGGPVVELTAATGTINVYQSTTNLNVNQPIVFTGTTFGGVTAGQTYYIQNVPSLITVAISLVSGSTNLSLLGLMPLGLSSATGTMSLVPRAYTAPLTVSSSTNTVPYTYTTATVAVTGTTSGTNVITCASTSTLAIGMPVVFSSGLGNLVAATVYYINSIVSTTDFTVSATFGGTTFVQTTVAGSVNLQQATTFLQVNQPIIFYRTVFGGVSAAVTYYVLTVPTSTTFTITTIPNFTAVTLSSTSGTMVVSVGPHPLMNVASTSSTTITNATFTVTATWAINNTFLVQVNNTYNMYVGMPITFSTTLGVLVANQVYFVIGIYDERRIQISPSPVGALGVNTITNFQTTNGTLLPLTTTTGSITMYQSTARLQINQPVVFYATPGALFGSGITAGTVYYVSAITASTGTFSVSTTPGGSSLSIGSAGGSNAQMAVLPLNWNVSVNNVYLAQPLPITTATTSSNILTVGNLTLVTATSIGTNLITCLSTSALSVGMPIAFSGSIGSLASATTYYVLTINSSTTFTVSQSWGGQVAILTNSFGGVYVQPSTANLSVGQALTFTGSVFGGFIAYTTYYVATIPSATTFTLATSVSNALAGSSISIATTTTGYMTAYGSTAGLLSNMTASIASNAPVIFHGITITVAATNGNNLYTPGNTGFLSLNQAVKFTGYTFGGVVAGTTYYVKAIVDSNTFTLSATPGGTVLSWTTGTNTMTMQAVSTPGTSLVPYNNYYVQSVPHATAFTISNTAGGAAITLTSGTGTNIVNSNTVVLGTGGSTTYFQPNQPVVFTQTSGSAFGGIETLSAGTLAYVITATNSSGNVITTASTSTLVIGQPVVFVGTVAGNITAFQTYYVQSIPSGTTFTVSTTVGGSAITLTTTSSQLFYMIPAYYVKAVTGSTQLVLSATPNGNPVAIGTGFSSGSNIMSITPQPMWTDFIEFDALIATNGVLERTGIIVPPNTYLYASSNTTQVSVVAIGIQELV